MTLSKKLIASALILLNFFLLHYIVSSIPLRFDLTSEGAYTLSQSSKKILTQLEEPVELTLYSSKSVENLPTWFKSFANRVEQMLTQYENAADGKIRLTVVDPKPDTPEEEQANLANLTGTEIPNGDRVFLGLVAAQGDKEATIPFFNWTREPFMEYEISKAIHEVQLLTQPRLGVLSSLPLFAPSTQPMPGQQPPQDLAIIEQLRGPFDVVEIVPIDTELVATVDLLMIVHPKGLSEEMLYAIDQHVLSGKPVFLALDPASYFDMQRSQQMMRMGQFGEAGPSELPGLLEAWGLDYDDKNAVIDSQIALTQGTFSQPSWLVFSEENIVRDLLPADDLEGILLLGSAPLSLAADATAQWTPVLTATSEAQLFPASDLQFTDPRTQLNDATPAEGTLTLAGLLSGPFKTAFPDGKPKSAAGEEEEEASESATHLASGEGTVFVISDSDFILDRYSVERSNFMGIPQIRRINGNQALAANFLEFLGGSIDLIGIRSKGAADRAFTVVAAMEKEAQQAYQEKLASKEAELAELGDRLTEMVEQANQSGAIQVTPEMQTVIEENQAKQAELRNEMREIRRELRQGIEALGNTIGAINLLWAPLALLCFAILFHRLRHR